MFVYIFVPINYYLFLMYLVESVLFFRALSFFQSYHLCFVCVFSNL